MLTTSIHWKFQSISFVIRLSLQCSGLQSDRFIEPETYGYVKVERMIAEGEIVPFSKWKLVRLNIHYVIGWRKKSKNSGKSNEYKRKPLDWIKNTFRTILPFGLPTIHYPLDPAINPNLMNSICMPFSLIFDPFGQFNKSTIRTFMPHAETKYRLKKKKIEK